MRGGEAATAAGVSRRCGLRTSSARALVVLLARRRRSSSLPRVAVIAPLLPHALSTPHRRRRRPSVPHRCHPPCGSLRRSGARPRLPALRRAGVGLDRRSNRDSSSAAAWESATATWLATACTISRSWLLQVHAAADEDDQN
ncbi:hypothetical protein PVAP13_5NG422740 [Panicum virgatum]|uniref:Uncharacterized protein n=1 Tax=Panicum virgatum TaxID=38727 RepID=A0A8T0S053_PANVG|nr:hypothetical protein PVAP13_5NG422740 [Panicum virgatum]